MNDYNVPLMEKLILVDLPRFPPTQPIEICTNMYRRIELERPSTKVLSSIIRGNCDGTHHIAEPLVLAVKIPKKRGKITYCKSSSISHPGEITCLPYNCTAVPRATGRKITLSHQCLSPLI